MRTGYAQLPLHGGAAPAWLFSRMSRLARELVCLAVSDHGPAFVLTRLSDPFWFQALGCVLGFDWHSSGLTTTTCAAIKEGLRGLEQDLGLYAAGGKGAASRKTPDQIRMVCGKLSRDGEGLVQASKLSAKVDNAAVQDGYQLYHHSFFFTAAGEWCVVQQGMNEANSMARRYHWLSRQVQSFVNEPHAAVCCDSQAQTVNLVASDSAAARDAMTELSAQRDKDVLGLLARLPELKLPRRHAVTATDINPRYLHKILLKTYEQAPADFESLLITPGVGAKTLRALALVAELIYGAPVSTRDPARFSFAHGGKDGTPYPVDRQTYETTIATLHDLVRRSKVELSEQKAAFRKLASFTVI